MHYDWETLSEGVYRCRLPFLDVTVGFVHGVRHTLLIDCGTTLVETTRITADISEITGGATVTKVVLTHHHFDHVLGSSGFSGAELFAAPAVTEALTDGLDQLRSQALSYGADRIEVDRALAAVRIPDHQILQAEIDLGGRQVWVEHLGRGHTNHDLIVTVPPVEPGGSTVVFCGDLVEESGDPAIDAESDVKAWQHTLDAVLAIGGAEAVYVPGHGAVVDASFLIRQRDWLAER